ncbi:MAG: hypothetical protein ACOCYW_03060 [Roseicyclus sp.]
MSLHDYDRNRHDPYAPPGHRPYEMGPAPRSSKGGLIAAVLLIALFGFILLGGWMSDDPATDGAAPTMTEPATAPATDPGATPAPSE